MREIALAFQDDKDPIERGRAVTESFMETEAASQWLLPIGVRKAKALMRMVETETALISPGELIVGRARRAIPAHRGISEGYQRNNALSRPDIHGGWLKNVENVPEGIDELFRYWRERYVSPARRLQAMLPPEERKAMARGVYSSHGLDYVHRNMGYDILLEKGMSGVKKEADERLAALDETRAAGSRAEDTKKRSFYEAAIICCNAAVRYAERYAEEAERLGRQEADAERKRELETIAAICRRVPAAPPRSLHEALQAIWFVHILDELEGSGSAQSFGRFDQYLYPFYKADVETGRLTPEDALELIECFWLKCCKTFDFQYVTIGGLRPDGEDGTNELSALCLEATARLKTPKSLGVRISKETPPEFFRRAIEVAKLGLGRPDFWNDEIVIEAFTRKGISVEDARDYASTGCVELYIPGRCCPRTMSHSINLLKCLELALHDGRDQLTDEQIGPRTGTEFKTYANLHRAYRRQAAHFIQLAIQHNVRAFLIQAEYEPMPFHSTLTHGCMESGRDVMNGGSRYNFAGCNLMGVADVANALAAIRKFVYEDGVLSLDRLRDILKNNFEGDEPLRQRLRNEAPKYGNDDPYVDRIAAEEAGFYCEEIGKYRTPEGGRFHALLFGTTGEAVYSWPKVLGASADGRRSGDPLSISCNSAQGTARKSATAEVLSAARIDHREAAGGVSFIVDIHPTAATGDEGTEKLLSLVQTYFEEGGQEIGFNILSEKELREAQKDPDRHAHLMVRLFGFSAQFTALDPELQEYVIEKTKHTT